MKLLALSMLLLAGLAHAGDLTARIKAGKSALADAEGQKYEATWGGCYWRRDHGLCSSGIDFTRQSRQVHICRGRVVNWVGVIC